MTRPDTTADRDVEAVAAVLADHTLSSGFDECGVYFKYACSCSAFGQDASWYGAHLVAALLPLIREREAAAWDSAVQAAAWLLDNGEPSAFAALAYTAKNNPYAGSEGA